MKLSALLDEVETKAATAQEVEISGITDCSAEVEKGNLFVCVVGRHADGHAFAEQAAARGAAALLTQRPLPIALPQVTVDDPRRAYAQLCAAFNGNPAQRLRLTAVTGTNGKTSTAWLLRHILCQSGCKTGLIGTIPEASSHWRETAHYTTPAPPRLHAMLQDMVANGITCAVTEASSQALQQQRLAGLQFACGVFTNLSPEHLDYHSSMEDYYAAKRMLFEQCDQAVINIDSPWGARLTREVRCRTVTVSAQYSMADYYISQPVFTARDTEFTLTHGALSCTIQLPLAGQYHVYNAACAVAAAAAYEVPMRVAANSLEHVPSVPGRLERLPLAVPFDVFIDYAHTPEALEQTLRSLRAVCRGRLICVFGCGGDRDRTKRPLMGKIAAKLSHFTIITNDNPRTEDEAQILDDIERGMQSTPHLRITDRATAIETAVRQARENDTVLIAGKGHEQYQLLRDGAHPFNEYQIAADAAQKWKKERTV